MSPVRPRSPAPKSVLSAVHFSHNSAGQKQVSPAEARYPSGKGEVCKTFMRRFDPDPRLQIFSCNDSPVYSHSPKRDEDRITGTGNLAVLHGSAMSIVDLRYWSIRIRFAREEERCLEIWHAPGK